VTTQPQERQAPRLNDKGYTELYLPDHPLIQHSRRNQGKGWVLEHRLILWHHLGPNDQPCHWCGWQLPWTSPAGYKHCINVDHLNADRLDNRTDNLVPACWYCNANRSWADIAPGLWATMLRQFRHIDPNERPSAIRWMAQYAERYVNP
jgi:hypothetical protein